MSEVLDQSEINALLAAVGAEAAPASAAHTAGEPRRRQREVAFVRNDAVAYNFKRPERISKEQIRALFSVHEVFARNFGAMLSGYLRAITDVRVVAVEQFTYSEFIHSLPNPTIFVTLRAHPLEGQMCLELSPLIAYPILDRLLGGTSGEEFIPQRPLTSIEWRLITRIIDRSLVSLSEVWRNLIDAKFEVGDTESNPELVHIVAPNEVVVFITFEIKVGQHAGTMSLCIPYNTIESVLGRLTSQAWFYRPKPPNEQHQARLVRNLHKGAVSLTAWLGQTRIRLSELRSLEPGDLLPLEKRAGRELILRVGERNKFAGRLGQVRGHKAIRIARRAEPDEPI